jgi:hypothetical protein
VTPTDIRDNEETRMHRGLTARNWLIFTLTTSLALFLSAATLNQSTPVASAAVENTPVIEAASINVSLASPIPELDMIDIPEHPIVSMEHYVKNYFADTPILAEIARCESNYRQYTVNGKVLRGRQVSQDVGLMQINETYHLSASKKLGYDIYTVEGNLGYGKYLYEKQGVQPWSASAPCWDR